MSPQTRGSIVLYHGTNARFERFDLAHAARPGMASNGHLGVWLAVDRSLALNFGEFCLDVRLTVAQAYLMSVGELRQLNERCSAECRDCPDDQVQEQACQFYARYREELCRQGFDVIFIQEIDGQVAMAIGLNPESLIIH